MIHQLLPITREHFFDAYCDNLALSYLWCATRMRRAPPDHDAAIQDYSLPHNLMRSTYYVWKY